MGTATNPKRSMLNVPVKMTDTFGLASQRIHEF
jgi:hypothetical protein